MFRTYHTFLFRKVGSDINFVLLVQIKEHLAKGQRMLAGDGMSQVTKTLLDLTQRKNFYAGDLLISVEILRNVTDTFKRASYIPASDGVQVRENCNVSIDGVYVSILHVNCFAH